jgi:indole-3-glycerol phosphate synthase
MILDDIIADKIPEVERRKRELPIRQLEKMAETAPPALDFAAALRGERIRVIAEVKKASPSKGVIRADFNPVQIAEIYAGSGAAAISVLTDKTYFMGSLAYLADIKKSVKTQIPLLRKDFIVDEYQVYEARAFGADAILLIAAVLDAKTLRNFLELSCRLGMKCLVEVHDEREVYSALESKAAIVGINNRDLHTFNVNVETTGKLRDLIPEGIITVSESGIQNRHDMEKLKEWNIDAVLIGESLMKSPDIAAAMKEFV